jgi:hypothetical protein
MWHPRKQVPCSLIRDTASLLVVTKGLHVANITLYLGFFPASQPSHLLAENEGMGQHPRERSLLLGVFVCYLRKQVPGGLIQDTASLPVLIRRLHVANITASLGFFPASQPNHLLARVQWGKQTPARAQAGAWGLCVPSAQAGSMHTCKLWREGRALATLPQTEHGQQSW